MKWRGYQAQHAEKTAYQRWQQANDAKTSNLLYIRRGWSPCGSRALARLRGDGAASDHRGKLGAAVGALGLRSVAHHHPLALCTIDSSVDTQIAHQKY